MKPTLLSSMLLLAASACGRASTPAPPVTTVAVVLDRSVSAIDEGASQLELVRQIGEGLHPGDRLLLITVSERSYRAFSVQLDVTIPPDTAIRNRFDPAALSAADRLKAQHNIARKKISQALTAVAEMPSAKFTDLYGATVLAGEALISAASTSVHPVLFVLSDLEHDATMLPDSPIPLPSTADVRVLYSAGPESSDPVAMAKIKATWARLLGGGASFAYYPPGVSVDLEQLRYPFRLASADSLTCKDSHAQEASR